MTASQAPVPLLLIALLRAIENNTKYSNTNIQTLISNGTLAGPRSNWFNNDGSYRYKFFSKRYIPDCSMIRMGNYGWLTVCGPVAFLSCKSIKLQVKPSIRPRHRKSLTDRYFVTKIAGGYGKSGEGPFVVYDKDTGYYYL